MAYWWVNHDKTHAHELGGGYIWCPKKNKAGRVPQTYKNLTLVKPGDVVFSYAGGRIQAIGVVDANHRDAQRPAYAGGGEDWDLDGWLVPISWASLEESFDPEPHFAQIQPLLPELHSPLNSLGNGAQNVYLGSISDALAALLLSLIAAGNPEVQDEIEEAEAQQSVLNDPGLSPTTKKQLVDARMGQGHFRKQVVRLGAKCRVSGTIDARVLVASHIKPWCKSTNAERLDGNNGLMLAPHVDRLFDRFLISFEDDGRLITAGRGVDTLMRGWGLDPELRTEPLRSRQRIYMAYHRDRLSQVAAKGLWR